MKNFSYCIILVLLLSACSKSSDFHGSDYNVSGGVFLLNEGKFMGGNGSLSFYSYDSSKISNDLFSTVNGRPLGDVPFSMLLHEDNGYIVVNNSGKIEVIDPVTIKSKTTINGLISPRYMAVVNNNKAYVTSLYSDSVAIIDLSSNSISGYINLRRTSEAIAVIGNKAYISNWVGGKEVMVVNTLNNQVVDSITVGVEPESMVVDRNYSLWVLCDGGYSGDFFAKLDQINTTTDKVQHEFTFPTKTAKPSCLRVSSIGQTIFYLDNGVKVMDINAGNLPASALIADPGASFYKIAVNPSNGDILVTDAVDFVQQGYLQLYQSDGTFINQFKAGIIPSFMCFKLRVN